MARVNRPCLSDWAKSFDLSDLSLLPEEKLSVSRLRIELLAGLTVALALVPEAVAFAFVAGCIRWWGNGRADHGGGLADAAFYQGDPGAAGRYRTGGCNPC